MNDRNVNPQPKVYIAYAFFIFDESTQRFKLQQPFLKIACLKSKKLFAESSFRLSFTDF